MKSVNRGGSRSRRHCKGLQDDEVLIVGRNPKL